jgi:hypothetical protein
MAGRCTSCASPLASADGPSLSGRAVRAPPLGDWGMPQRPRPVAPRSTPTGSQQRQRAYKSWPPTKYPTTLAPTPTSSSKDQTCGFNLQHV